jgi:hypothetical protein
MFKKFNSEESKKVTVVVPEKEESKAPKNPVPPEKRSH